MFEGSFKPYPDNGEYIISGMMFAWACRFCQGFGRLLVGLRTQES